jgi:hypothetical protein
MRELTAILLILIAVIAIIAIAIVKLYYRDKEGNDDDNKEIEDFIARNEIDRSRPRRFRNSNPAPRVENNRFGNYSEAQIYANTINNGESRSDLFDDYYNEPISREKVLANDVKARAPKSNGKRREQVRTAPTSQRAKPQSGSAGVKPRQEPIKPEHTAAINRARKPAENNHRQVPMTKKQKEFISSDSKQALVVENPQDNVKVIKSIKPVTDSKEEAKITEKADADKKEAPKTVQKPAKETPKTTGTPKAEEKPIKETPKAEEKPAKETPKVEEKPIKETPKVEEKPIKETPKVETQTSEVIEDEYSYHDDLDLILGKRTQEESPVEDEIQSEVQEVEDNLSKGSDIFRDAIASIRNIRGNIGSNNNESSSESFEPPVAEEVNKSLGEDIEYDEFISITPIHEEEKEAQYPKDLAYNQPNKDVDYIYKEINKESYNKTVDEELDKSFEDVDDDTYKTDAKEYTAEDYKKIEDDMAEEKIREENTKKLLGLSEEKTEKPKDGILRATGPMERKTAPKLEKGQERLVLHNHIPNVEEVNIDGTLYELKAGTSVIFNHNNENYESTILKVKPGHIGVKYRSKKIWVKTSAVKKVFR